MAKQPRALTAFGKDIDTLLEKAGRISIREYADQANVSYKYVNQLRTVSTRQPGKLYPNLLKLFVRLELIDLVDSHQLSLRHRNKPLSIAECQELFPGIPEQELVESVKQALEPKDRHDIVLEAVAPSLFYHRVFVGRETELGLLHSAFDNAVSGQGSLVMVVGEPGIGKTALCEKLSNYVTSCGGKVLVGHCYSEKSLSLPYLAFIEVLRSTIQAGNFIELREELGSGADSLARIVPEIREKLQIQPTPEGDPDEERYRLMEAVTNFLSNITTTQPLLIILEDLHNADAGTLEMLTYVSRYLEGKRFLLVGTYRSEEVDRSHPLSATLAELRRLPNFGRVILRGLNADEVRRMISSITGQDVPSGLSELVHQHTEGNPLFVQEVTWYLVKEGLFSPQSEIGQSAGDILAEMRIPEGLRDVIGKRLSSLSGSCNSVLAITAVIGRDFPLEVLRKVARMTDDEIFKALEEAKKAAVIEERSGVGSAVHYHFAHAFFRRTLYEEIIAPRRNSLHQQVAQALEEVYKNRLEEHTAELAEHFSHSSDLDDLEKAVSYGETAARQSMDVYAYREAARLLEQTLEVQYAIDSENRDKLCELYLSRAEALHWAGDYQHVLDVELPKAMSLAEAIGDKRQISRACDWAMHALGTYGSGVQEIWETPEAAWWVEHADRYAGPDTVERVRADSNLGIVKWVTGYKSEGVRLLSKAVDLGRRLDDAIMFWLAVYNWFFYVQAPQHAKERLLLAEEMAATPRPGGGILRFGGVLVLLIDAFLQAGQRQRAEEIHRELESHVQRSGAPYMIITLAISQATLSYLDGCIEDAVEICRRVIIQGEEFGIPDWARRLVLYRIARPQLNLGKAAEALQLVDALPLVHPFIEVRALYLAHLHRDAEVMEILEQRVLARPYIGSTDDETAGWSDVSLLEAAVMIGHQQVTDVLLRKFSGIDLRTTGLVLVTCVDRHLGAAATLLDRPEEARTHYQEALKVATDMRFRPELALTRLQLAELLLEHYPDEKAEALEHLDFAINEFREMKMQPSLERARWHREIRGA